MSDPTEARIAERYRVFAQREATGVSPLYESLALAVAECRELLQQLAGLPPGKEQPNLLLAAVRHLCGTPRDAAQFLDWTRARWPEIEAIMLARSTQTNEPARCATLLPLLARLAQPLALLEVGASAGLCLLPDRYGYDYGRRALRPDAQAPVFPCRADEATPLPEGLPQVVWRAGLDLNPLDLAEQDQAGWLETLVWPEQEARAERLRLAIALARQDPPRLLQGDLLGDLRQLAADAPPAATLVIFHSAVLAYLATIDERMAFVEQVRSLPAVWISNEAPTVLPDLSASLHLPEDESRFLMLQDGKPCALTGPHGQSIDWIT